MEFTTRRTAFEKQSSYKIEDNNLVISNEAQGRRTVPLRDIIKVNPVYAPTRYNKNVYLVNIVLSSGETLKISNQEYVKLASFNDRSQEYIDFLKALHGKLADINSTATFTVGLSKGKFILLAGIYYVSVALIILIGAVMAFFGKPIYGVILIVLGLLNFLGARKYAKNNKPQSYNPREIPENQMPEIK